jgi:DNA-binding HxlR family transcriptional regulator
MPAGDPGSEAEEISCDPASVLDIVAEKWIFRILQELLFGPRRFSNIIREFAGISPNILTDRLRRLESRGVIRRRRLPQPYKAIIYELTAWGSQVQLVLTSLSRWSTAFPVVRREPTTARGLIMLLGAAFDPDATADERMMIGFHIGEEVFGVGIQQGALHVNGQIPSAAGLHLFGGAETIAAALTGPEAFADLEFKGSLIVAGERALVGRLFRLFPIQAAKRDRSFGEAVGVCRSGRPLGDGDRVHKFRQACRTGKYA